MKNNLLILGAGIYALVAKEIAQSMTCFEKIDFIDDNAKQAPDGTPTIGAFADIDHLARDYRYAVVAIGNPEVRLEWLQRLQESAFCVATLVSPRAYVSPSAQLGKGCIVEPMSVIHTGCVLGMGCLVSAGAVINHVSLLGDGVHVDCNATVAGYMNVSRGTKIESGTVFKVQKPHGPLPVDGREYCFEDGM